MSLTENFGEASERMFTRHLEPSVASGSRSLLIHERGQSRGTIDDIDGRAERFAVEKWYGGFGKCLHQRRIEILRMLVFGHRFSPALDIGCGEGLLGIIGLPDVIGTDVRRGRRVTILASAERLPFRSESFELVFAGEVIEHLNEPGRALEDWARVLKAGGGMVISTPNGFLVGHTGGHPEHKRTLGPDDIKKSLTRLGLTITYARGVFTGLISGRRLFRWIAFESVKMALLRIPVPLALSYDLFVRAEKSPERFFYCP